MTLQAGTLARTRAGSEGAEGTRRASRRADLPALRGARETLPLFATFCHFQF